MARKSKRMALYEAIRQGQAKIAQGLESGQMRSDGQGQQNSQKQNMQQTVSRRRLVAQSALFERRTSAPGVLAGMPLRLKAAMAGGAVVILLLVIWLAALLKTDQAPVEPTGNPPGIPSYVAPTPPPAAPIASRTPEKPAKPVEEPPKTGFFGFGKETPKAPEPEKAPEPVIPSSVGQNVIVIQGISASRRDELLPLQAFFDEKGIPTEIILNRSGYAVLVTRQGFEQNPASEGTDGYRLMQKIRQLGLVYPQETGDTKWGTRPFQEAYGYKR